MAGLSVEDLLMAVNGQPVEDCDAFDTAMAKVLKDRPKVLTIAVQREFDTHYVFIEPDWAKMATPPAPKQKGE